MAIQSQFEAKGQGEFLVFGLSNGMEEVVGDEGKKENPNQGHFDLAA